jgi:putative tryptophan/tyrosine transport system substrate-binding protein
LMRRRDFVALAGAAAAFPCLAFAQQAKMPRIAVVANVMSDDRKLALIEGLGDYGYLIGKDIQLDFFVAPTIDDVPDYAARAIGSKPDLIWTLQSAAPVVVKALTSTIPVVFTNIADPVAIGLVASLAHPGGNMTGNMQGQLDVANKQVSLVREILPMARRLAFIGLPADPNYSGYLSQISPAAKQLGFDISLFETTEGASLTGLFDRVKADGAEAVIVQPVSYLSTVNPVPIAQLAIDRELPLFGTVASTARSGWLLGYGANIVDVIRRSTNYVSAILNGARPGDLPIEGPTLRDLAVNLKTARALGITVPQSVLFQATEIIQ